jgi:cyclopropane-fatty-acyl-phospholipid synthase
MAQTRSFLSTPVVNGLAVRSGRKALRAVLARLRVGAIEWVESGQRTLYGDPESARRATVEIHDPRCYAKMLSGGSVGAGEAYAEGWWSSPDPAAVVSLLIANQAAADRLDAGSSWVRGFLETLLRPLRDNTRRGSKRNIADHYDLGNDFFEQFLDPTMTYSAGVFRTPESTMEQASIEKLDLICRKLGLTSDDHVVEIGTGWGSFALHAATNYGCRVTTTTISSRQHEVAERRFAQAGLNDRITLLKKDYRDLVAHCGAGTFSHLVSIEMIEAVGHRHLNRYFQSCSDLLRADGVMAIQAILIDDRHQAAHRRRPVFIMRHIFPGACLPSNETISQAVAASSDLTLRHFQDITPHYGTTLRRWRERLQCNVETIRALGYPDRLLRL